MSLSELTPAISNMEITHLSSQTSKYKIIVLILNMSSCAENRTIVFNIVKITIQKI